MRRVHRSTAAIPHDVDPANGGVRTESNLDRLGEIGVETNVARGAVRVRLHLLEAVMALLRSPTTRADHVPRQIEQPGLRGVQEQLQHLSTIRLPAVREDEG